LDEKSKKALKKVQDIVMNYKINIQDIFNHFDKDKSGKLDENEFHNFICKIDPTLTFLESTSVFEKIDRYNKKKITFEEFAILFNEYDFSDLNDFATVLINELREIIKTYKLNLKDIFTNFDKDG
jgi:Ca2+-binding EF-hand superfamily protein